MQDLWVVSYDNGEVLQIFLIFSGNDVVVILMRNIIGPLNEKIICKYDLKGSTIGRETNLDVENIGKIIMKDNNFIETEHYLFMDKAEITMIWN